MKVAAPPRHGHAQAVGLARPGLTSNDLVLMEGHRWGPRRLHGQEARGPGRREGEEEDPDIPRGWSGLGPPEGTGLSVPAGVPPRNCLSVLLGGTPWSPRRQPPPTPTTHGERTCVPPTARGTHGGPGPLPRLARCPHGPVRSSPWRRRRASPTAAQRPQLSPVAAASSCHKVLLIGKFRRILPLIEGQLYTTLQRR